MDAHQLLSKFAKLPPHTNETANQYYNRIGNAWSIAPGNVKVKVFRMLKAMGFDDGDRGFNRLKQELNVKDHFIPEKKEYKETSDGASIEYEGRESITSEKQAIQFFKIDVESG